MTASDLEEVLVARLTREKGGTSQEWRRALGKVIVRDAGVYAHCNWDITPSGTFSPQAIIERVLDDVRLEHPILTDN